MFTRNAEIYAGPCQILCNKFTKVGFFTLPASLDLCKFSNDLAVKGLL